MDPNDTQNVNTVDRPQEVDAMGRVHLIYGPNYLLVRRNNSSLEEQCPS